MLSWILQNLTGQKCFYGPLFDKAVATNFALHGKKFDLPLISETTSTWILLLTDLIISKTLRDGCECFATKYVSRRSEVFNAAVMNNDFLHLVWMSQ